ncbi:MAG: hypothetical protein K8R09_01265, partial [Desulfobacterales bacterium]|nr:hypothetical protein [Desulfobacterales bacterium]
LACCKGIIDTLMGNKGWGWNLEMCSPEKSSMRNNYGTIHSWYYIIAYSHLQNQAARIHMAGCHPDGLRRRGS